MVEHPNMAVEDFRWIAEQSKHRCNQFALGGRGDPDQHEHFEELLGKASARVSPGNRDMNATLQEMDKATLSAQITRDNEATLTDRALSVFSVAQIAGLLNLAIDRKATRCTARLLDYKNAHFPEFAEVSEFSLDW